MLTIPFIKSSNRLLQLGLGANESGFPRFARDDRGEGVRSKERDKTGGFFLEKGCV